MNSISEYTLADIFPISLSGEWGSEPVPEGNALVLRAADFTKDCKLRGQIGALRKINQLKLDRLTLQKGDILIEKSGGSPDQPVGRVVFFDREDEGIKYVPSNFLQLLRVADGFDKKFSYYLMTFLYYCGFVYRYQQQTTGIINLKLENYFSTKVAIPSRLVQERIQEILSTIDRAIAHTEALIEKYQQIKAGLMHDLFTRGIGADGKLRPLRDEAPELYQESAIGWIPREWNCIKASDICFPVTKGTTPSAFEANNQTDSIPYIRVENLSFDGSLIFLEGSFFVSKKSHNSELLRSRVYPNDILMNIVGPPLGKVSVVPDTYKEWNTNQAIAIYRLLDRKNRNYLLYYLLSGFSQKWFYIRSKQTSGQVNLTLEMCNELEIPFPNREEEVLQIAHKLSCVFEIIQLENANLRKLNQKKKGLMQDLLTGKVPVKVDPDKVDHVSN